jgi:hypothetical protein
MKVPAFERARLSCQRTLDRVRNPFRRRKPVPSAVYKLSDEMRPRSTAKGFGFKARFSSNRVTDKGLIGFAAEKRAGSDFWSGRKLMRPPGELNPGGLAGRLPYGVSIALTKEHAQVMAAEARLDGRVPPFFGAASGGPCATHVPSIRVVEAPAVKRFVG